MSKIILIGGGVRCGKSAFAVDYARQIGATRGFVATAQAYDDDMRARIAAHRLERGDDFSTLEAPLLLTQALSALQYCDVIVVDCLTLWLSNLLLSELSQAEIAERVRALVDTLHQLAPSVLLVTNEVGMGVVPESALGRAFRDVCGRAHQVLGRAADEIYFAALGQLLRIKPGPVTLTTGSFS